MLAIMMGIMVNARNPRVQELLDETGTLLATAFHSEDGWHLKHANRHDRHAWQGPFATLDDAVAQFAPISATGSIAGLVR